MPCNRRFPFSLALFVRFELLGDECTFPLMLLPTLGYVLDVDSTFAQVAWKHININLVSWWTRHTRGMENIWQRLCEMATDHRFADRRDQSIRVAFRSSISVICRVHSADTHTHADAWTHTYTTHTHTHTHTYIHTHIQLTNDNYERSK